MDRDSNWLIEHILANWEDWDVEACQAAQVAQDHAAWGDVMRDHLRTAVIRARHGDRLDDLD